MQAKLAAELLDALNQQFSASASAVAQTWTVALTQHQQASAHLIDGIDRTLQDFGQNFDTRAQDLVATLRSSWTEQQAQQGSFDQQRLATWQTALDAVATSLQERWQAASEQTLAQQQQVCDALSQTAAQIRSDSQAQNSQTLGEITRLLASSEELVRARIASEAEAATLHNQRAQELAALLRTELSALREQEAQRGEAEIGRAHV